MSDLISRQAVIDILKHSGVWHDRIEAIEALPSAEPNPLCALADRECPFQGKEFVWCLTCPHISEEDRTLVKKAVEPKTGRWVEVDQHNGTPLSIVDMRCNQCGKYATMVLPIGTTCVYDYCPYCGAYMRSK